MLTALALALTTTSIAAEPGTADVGWGGVKVTSEDGDHSLTGHVMVMARANYSDFVQPVSSVGWAHLRPMAIFEAPGLSFMLHAEFAGTARIIDARADVELSDRLVLSAGQLIIPMTRSWNVPRPVLAGPERSVANNAFAPGRSMGVFVRGTNPSDTMGFHAGLYDASPFLFVVDPNLGNVYDTGVNPPAALLRFELHPQGSLPATELPAFVKDSVPQAGVGLAVTAQPVQFVLGENEPQLTGTVDVAYQQQRIGLLLEGFGRWTETGGVGVGGTAQAMVFVVPRTVNVGARVSATDMRRDDAVDLRLLPEGFVAWFIRDTHAMIQARMGYAVGGDVLGVSVAEGPYGTVQAQLRY